MGWELWAGQPTPLYISKWGTRELSHFHAQQTLKAREAEMTAKKKAKQSEEGSVILELNIATVGEALLNLGDADYPWGPNSHVGLKPCLKM